MGLAVAVLGLVSSITTARAYPLQGDAWPSRSRMGRKISVILSGDEFHLSARTPDGYALIKDP